MFVHRLLTVMRNGSGSAMGTWQLGAAKGLSKALALALLVGTAGCSDDFARFGGGITTASLGIEPSNQDRIIRKIGTRQVPGVAARAPNPGIAPAGTPEQAYPGDVAEAPAPAETYVAPAVETATLAPLRPAEPAVVAQPPVAASKREPRRVRRIESSRLAAAGIPVVPPVPKPRARLRRIGDTLTTGSVAPAPKPAPVVRGGQTYTVVSGDTIYAIARRAGISSRALMEANGLSSSALGIGQKLVIPGPGAPARTVATARVVEAARTPRVRAAMPAKPQPAAKPVRRVDTASTQAAKPVRSAARAADATKNGFAWPAKGRILAGFGQRTPRGTNDGIDIALPVGTPVRAVADGIVLYAGSKLENFGELVLVRHDDGWVSAYANASKRLVKRGDRVRQGQAVIHSGQSGDAPEPQVHFELRRNSRPVDPTRYLDG